MKRILALIFTLLYLATTAGVSIGVHYCGKTISSVSFYQEPGNCDCAAKRKSPKRTCCTKETHFFQLKTDHKAVNSHHFQPVFSTAVLPSPIKACYSLPVTSKCLIARAPAPPDKSRPLYLLKAVFLI